MSSNNKGNKKKKRTTAAVFDVDVDEEEEEDAAAASAAKAKATATAANKAATTTTTTNNKKKKKRAVVQLADDAGAVLRRCRALRRQLVQKYEFEGSEAQLGGGGNNGELSTVPKDLVEVSELSSLEVLEGMECVAVGVAQQVLQRKGFTLDIPSRASSNQVYVKEWDRYVKCMFALFVCCVAF